MDPAIIEAALADVGALDDGIAARSLSTTDAESAVPATVSAEGLIIESDSGALVMRPIVDGDGALTDTGVAVFEHTSDSAFALTNSEQGANAAYSVLLGPDAPTEYAYEFEVDGTPAVLEATEGGGVAVLDSAGNVVNLLAPAWAKDANGAGVPTDYVIDGNTVTQVVHTTDETAYPVVADPRLQCDGL